MIVGVLHGIPVLSAIFACQDWSSKGIWALITIINTTSSYHIDYNKKLGLNSTYVPS